MSENTSETVDGDDETLSSGPLEMKWCSEETQLTVEPLGPDGLPRMS